MKIGVRRVKKYDMKQKTHSLKYLKEKRSELRQFLTLAEAYLWKHLKSRQFEGRCFTR